jgi:hypothetical protein
MIARIFIDRPVFARVIAIAHGGTPQEISA